MAMNVQQLLEKEFPVVEHTFTEIDSIRYALSLGLGMSPTDLRQLRYVYEECEGGLLALPAMASVLAYAGHWARDPSLGLDWKRILLGEQRIELHRPVPTAGSVAARTRVTSVVDKGRDKGAVLYARREIDDQISGVPIATVTMVTVARGDGGQGSGGNDEPAPLMPIPSRSPEAMLDFPSSPQAALLYRLAGDRNPLHADPKVAAQAGYPAPILHGLCSFAIATWCAVEAACIGDPARVKSLEARFTAPVFPGEILRTEVWTDGGTIHFRTSVPAREATVIDRGTIRLAPCRTSPVTG